MSLSPSGDQGSTIERDRDTYEFSIVRQEEGSDDFSIEYHDQVKVYYVITGNGITDNDYSFWTNACLSGSDETGDYFYFPAGGTTINMTLQVKNDSENEDDEVLTLSLAGVVDDGAYSGCCSGGCCTCCCGGSSCCGGSPINYSIDGSADEAFFTIADDDGWALKIERSSAGNEIIERTGEATFKVTRVDDGGPGGSGDLTHPIRVDMTMSGLAQQYVDYNVRDSVGYLQIYGDRTVIDAGDAFAEFTLASINDRLRELDEDVVISIDGGESIGIWGDDSSCCGGGCCGGGSSYYLNSVETFNADSMQNSASVTIKDDDGWKIQYEVIDEIAIEPCTWIPGEERTGAVQVNKVIGPSGDSDPTYDIDIVFNLAGSASPANGGFDGDYHLTTSPSGGDSSAVIMVNQGGSPPKAILTIPKDEATSVIYVMPNGDHIFEADETVVLTATKAYPEDTDSENFDIHNNTPNGEITILQPPEFLSSAEADPLPSPIPINQDYYTFYYFVGGQTNDELPGKKDVSSEHNRSVQYSIQSGNDDGYFQIDISTGEITLARAVDDQAASIYTLEIWVHDTDDTRIRDVATVTLSGVTATFTAYADQPVLGQRDVIDIDTYDVGHSFWGIAVSNQEFVNDYIVDELRVHLTGRWGYGPIPTANLNPLLGRYTAPGELRNDTTHSYDVESKKYNITSLGRIESVLMFTRALLGPSTYDLQTNNCTDKAIQAGAAAGIALRDTQGSYDYYGVQLFFGSNPGDFGEDLILDGGTRNP